MGSMPNTWSLFISKKRGLKLHVCILGLRVHGTFRLRYNLKLLKMCHIYPPSNRYQFYVNSGITYHFKWTTKLIKIKMATLKVNFQAGFFTQNFLYSIILLPILLLHCIIPKINTKNSFNKNEKKIIKFFLFMEIGAP